MRNLRQLVARPRVARGPGRDPGILPVREADAARRALIEPVQSVEAQRRLRHADNVCHIVKSHGCADRRRRFYPSWLRLMTA
jgi:hypothetical protein